MSQPKSTELFTINFNADERNLILAFINVGFKSEMARVGLHSDAGAITNNAVYLLKKFSEAKPVKNEDITDPPASNP